MTRPFRIALVGPSRDATGGVASSVRSVASALSETEGVAVLHLGWKEVGRLPLWRPDIVHCNFSRPAKRLLGVLLARGLGAKAVATVHSDLYDHSDRYNRLLVQRANGLVLLNPRINNDFAARYPGLPVALQTPILKRTRAERLPDLDPELSKALSRFAGRKIALAYAFEKAFHTGAETYGFRFLGDLLPELDEMGYAVVFLDLKGQYSEADVNPHGMTNVLHLKHPAPFRSLLRRVDVYLRPTSTDGNSVAVLEALEEDCPVLASDAVTRPLGVRTYRFGSRESFLQELAGVARDAARPGESAAGLTSAADYLSFVRSL